MLDHSITRSRNHARSLDHARLLNHARAQSMIEHTILLDHSIMLDQQIMLEQACWSIARSWSTILIDHSITVLPRSDHDRAWPPWSARSWSCPSLNGCMDLNGIYFLISIQIPILRYYPSPSWNFLCRLSSFFPYPLARPKPWNAQPGTPARDLSRLCYFAWEISYFLMSGWLTIVETTGFRQIIILEIFKKAVSVPGCEFLLFQTARSLISITRPKVKGKLSSWIQVLYPTMSAPKEIQSLPSINLFTATRSHLVQPLQSNFPSSLLLPSITIMFLSPD